MNPHLPELGVSEEKRGEIREFLTQLERQHQIEILYACESGSRAWGFASPDSDYDIRFIFSAPEHHYRSISPLKDNIEIPIENDLDAGGWDVKKSLSLLRKSNGALIEWLHSPIVYLEKDAFLSDWRNTSKAILSERALINHYRGLATQFWKSKLQGNKVKAKSYLYCLRAVLSAEWVARHHSNPPVPFEQLLPLVSDDLETAIHTLLKLKSKTGEKDSMKRMVELDQYLGDYLDSPLPDSSQDAGDSSSILDATFAKWTKRGGRLSSIKEINYRRSTEPDLCLFRTIAGSQAYGTSHSKSDTDYRAIFALPSHLLGNLTTCEQVQDERGDDVSYELEKFIGMLQKNNPNMMELLFMPKDCILHQNPLWSLIKPDYFLSKKCELSFANYAVGQIKKARGLNKKIVNPEPEERKQLIEFCFVLHGQGSIPIKQWATEHGYDISTMGLVNCQHAPDIFSLYADQSYRGLFSPKSKDELIFSSVTKEAIPVGWMSCNFDAYKQHCKSHREYWQWVKNRNEDRYQTSNASGYDAKNMMHTLRLLDIAEEIATEGLIRIRRPNRDFLMQVRSGEFSYEYLLNLAEEKTEQIKEAYKNSNLPEEPDFDTAAELLAELRLALA